jgi:hypothetical protein
MFCGREMYVTLLRCLTLLRCRVTAESAARLDIFRLFLIELTTCEISGFPLTVEHTF